MSRAVANTTPWRWLFVSIAVLVLAQVIWWSVVFQRNVEEIRSLKSQLLSQSANVANVLPEIQKEAFHSRVMFVSESAFFVALLCVGMFLLFRALKAEQRMRESQRNFVDVVSHESRTPLTALKLRLESLLEKPIGEVVAKEVRSALDEVRRLISLFEKVLALNRYERHSYEFEPLYLSDVVRETLTRMEPFLRSKGVRLETRLDADVRVRGDALSLQNCFQNLVENAAVYNDKPEKCIQVEVTPRANHVVLGVADNGPGISSDDRDRVFERFFRGRAGRLIPGSGLGLYIARTIIEAHDGVLRLTRASDLGGTRFEIELPAVG